MTQRSNEAGPGADAERVRALTGWYGREHRKLPWRAEPGALTDAYRTLVSEAMLQQTQVATVVGYFERFIERFPTVQALAAADEGAVLAQWQGLGYYRRARHLHQAARAIVDDHGGRMPTSAAALQKLPGVGRYTAGAVASIAFGEAAALVDGNVARVMARWHAYTEPVDSTAGKKWVWAAAERFIDILQNDETFGARDAQPVRPGDWNQALMELGARICTPKAPACLLCPVAEWCAAHRKGVVDRVPVAGRRTVQRPVVHRVLAVRRKRAGGSGAWLIERRGDGGLWAGMWQMPTQEMEPGDTDASIPDSDRKRPSAAGLAAWVRERFGLDVSRPRHVEAFEHLTTHRRIRFELWRADATGGRLRPGAGRWVTLDGGELAGLALSNPQRRIVAALRQNDLTPDRK